MLGNTPTQHTGEFLKKLFFSKTVLSRLLLINTTVYVIVQILETVLLLFSVNTGEGSFSLGFIAQFFALPSNLATLAVKPWTIFTYMFLHEGFVHLLFNMVMLYFGSTIFLEYLGAKKLLQTYIIGGLVGAVFFIAAFNIFPAFGDVKDMAVALGASASVLAIIIAVASYVPDYTVHLLLIGRVKLKHLAIAFVVIDLLSIRQGNAGGHIAHLGGALWGFIYAFSLKNGHDITSMLNGIHFPKFTFRSPSKNFTASRPRNKRSMSDEEYNVRKVKNQEEIDRILDKISKSGYASLSKEEKELLFKTSNNN